MDFAMLNLFMAQTAKRDKVTKLISSFPIAVKFHERNDMMNV